MGLGYALREDLGIEEGQVSAAHLGDYKMSNIADTAGMRVECLRGGKGVGALNVKGIGELPIDGVAPAIANAIRSLGIDVRDVPALPEVLMQAPR